VRLRSFESTATGICLGMPNAIVVSYANSLAADVGMKLYPGHLAEVIDVKALEGNIHRCRCCPPATWR
jgi:hypothetical protein